ncbi:unnamed protein product, partial [Mesorhabditis belari]|uniref:Lysine--tRNA ligase n=1 Tax=Mesorhabditis belari TaxID=2138241 RepID=A0AAF3FUL6_9BILA
MFCLVSISKNEQKRLEKQKRQEQERKEKEEKLAVEKAAKGGDQKVEKLADPSDPQEYYNMRVRMIEEKRASGGNPFPHKFHVSTSLGEFIEKYSSLKNEEILENVTVSIAGRIYSKREAGANLIFYDVQGEGTRLQVMANARMHKMAEEFKVLHGKVKRGDIM